MTMPETLASAEASYSKKYEAAFAEARAKYADLPVPVVMGGKSRPLTKKWKPKSVGIPSTMAFAAPSGPRISVPMVSPAQTAAPEETSATDTSAALASETVTAAAAAPAETAKISEPVAGTVAGKPVPLPLAAEEAGVKVPVPAENPNQAAAETAPAPVKKKRWWMLGS